MKKIRVLAVLATVLILAFNISIVFAAPIFGESKTILLG